PRMAAMRQRQQEELEFDRVALRIIRIGPGHDPDRLVTDNGQEFVERLLARLLPGGGEDFALHLAAEQRADARAGETVMMFAREAIRQHESIAQRLADRRRIDVVALRRRPRAAPLVPISVQFARRRVFHGVPLSRSETEPPVLSPFETGWRGFPLVCPPRSRARAARVIVLAARPPSPG